MKRISRKLSNLIRLTEHPYTDRVYKVLHKSKGNEFNKNFILDILSESLIENKLYSLKIDFAFSGCDNILSTIVTKVSTRTFKETMERLIKSNFEKLEAVNIDFFITTNPKVYDFTENAYLGSFMFIVV